MCLINGGRGQRESIVQLCPPTYYLDSLSLVCLCAPVFSLSSFRSVIFLNWNAVRPRCVSQSCFWERDKRNFPRVEFSVSLSCLLSARNDEVDNANFPSSEPARGLENRHSGKRKNPSSKRIPHIFIRGLSRWFNRPVLRTARWKSTKNSPSIANFALRWSSWRVGVTNAYLLLLSLTILLPSSLRGSPQENFRETGRGGSGNLL